MTQEDFEIIVNRRLEKIKELLLVKGKEYIRNGDKLHNFNRAARMRETDPINALQGMLDKHLVSWLDLVDDMTSPDRCRNHITPKLIDEKLGDIVVYFILAEAVVYQERGWEVKP